MPPRRRRSGRRLIRAAPPYTDARAPLVDGQPESHRYRASYRGEDQAVGDWSECGVMSPELKRDLMDIAWGARSKNACVLANSWTEELDPKFARPAEAIPNKVIQNAIDEVATHLFSDTADSASIAELGTWIVELFGSPDAAAWAMPGGMKVKWALAEVSIPEKRRDIWRVIHDCIEAALPNEEALQNLACCWFEHFVDEDFDVRQLFEHGMSPEMASAIQTHTGYMDAAEQAELRRRLRRGPS